MSQFFTSESLEQTSQDGRLLVLAFRGLCVVRACETPHDVVSCRLVQMLLQVVEDMLRDVVETHVLTPLDRAKAWLQLASQQLDHRRLSGDLGDDHGNTR